LCLSRMEEQLTVYLNGTPVHVFRGMKVKHALIGAGHGLYEACLEGRAKVHDENGFVLGLDGAVYEGARLEVRPTEE
jgi:hypothetical protein